MNKKGTVSLEADGFKVKFSRVLEHDINTVWDAITNPDKMKYWFTDIEMDQRPGSKMIIRFRDENKTETYGQVVAIDKPHRFEFTWEGELGIFELFELPNNRTRLNFTYSKMADEYATNAPAGFHILLNRLQALLDGDKTIYPFGTEEFSPESNELKKIYEEDVYKIYPEMEKLKPLVIERLYSAPVKKVWKAITDKDQMKHWYFDLDDFKPEVGFTFQFTGEGKKGEKYLHHCEITEVLENQKLTYSWKYEGYEGMSFVTFELFPEKDKTKLRLTHRGVHTFPATEDFARECFNAGWTELIGTSLKNFVEGI